MSTFTARAQMDCSAYIFSLHAQWYIKGKLLDARLLRYPCLGHGLNWVLCAVFIAGSCGLYIIFCICRAPWGRMHPLFFARALHISQLLFSALFPTFDTSWSGAYKMNCCCSVIMLFFLWVNEVESSPVLSNSWCLFLINVHQLCVAVPCRIIKFWAFLGIMLQVCQNLPLHDRTLCHFIVSSLISMLLLSN
jgi:hypothetical protein